MIKDQWNLDNIDTIDNDDKRDTEVPGDTDNGAREQGMANKEIETLVEMPPQKQKGIRKILMDQVIRRLERTAKLVKNP